MFCSSKSINPLNKFMFEGSMCKWKFSHSFSDAFNGGFLGALRGGLTLLGYDQLFLVTVCLTKRITTH